MSVVTYFTIPTQDFIFEELLGSYPDIRLRFETMVPTGSTLVPYCWITGGDVEAIHAALEDSPVVTSVRLLDQLEDQALFRIEWSDELDGVLDVIQDAEAILLEGSATTDTWSFRLRFPDYEALSAFYRTCLKDDIELTLERMHNPVEPRDLIGYGLTPRQRETLRAALESGYFEVPRQSSLVELSDQLGISDAAASQRLRRGINALIAATLAIESAESSSDEG